MHASPTAADRSEDSFGGPDCCKIPIFTNYPGSSQLVKSPAYINDPGKIDYCAVYFTTQRSSSSRPIGQTRRANRF